MSLLVVASMAGFWSLRPPAWWTSRLVPMPEASTVGENLERGLLAVVTRVEEDRGEGAADSTIDIVAEERGAGGRGFDRSWAIRVDEAQLNAWLATRLPAWLAHLGVEAVVDLRVKLEPGRVSVAGRLPADSDRGSSGGTPDELQNRSTSRGIVYGIDLAISVEDGRVVLRPTAARVGRLPVPVSRLPLDLAKLSERWADEWAERSDKPSGIEFDGTSWWIAPFDLGDGRVVEIVDIEVRRHELRLRGVTGLRAVR